MYISVVMVFLDLDNNKNIVPIGLQYCAMKVFPVCLLGFFACFIACRMQVELSV